MKDMSESAGDEAEGLVKNAILIAGPTASGKSALALEIARQTGGCIVNTDSMQVYSVLNVLTARPGADELAAVPHHLYGHVDPAINYSAGRWLADVKRLRDEGVFEERRPIFTGGTGLYFRGLAEGLSEMPDIPQSVRDRWRYRLLEEGSSRLHAILMREDPKAAAVLRASDGQRIARALEVLQASERSILDWQAERGHPLIDRGTAKQLVVEADRAALNRRIDRRFDRMLDLGALQEVEALLARELDPELPAMKAIGVRELQSAIAGVLPFDEAIERAKIATRQYGKRQATWFRHQLGQDWRRIPLSDDAEAIKIAASQVS
ncbi:tRNA (adenosine(37)-N6)-dimethylallyltransferase MiaA [Neomesorhizobium albiziae]|uniref:tRNA (adenosine(37)-N6)-dimethylallyltransferase MiaA n=1 Tax=Neomesorhizobium albiziae TaxID=335020 RepID=UPI00235C4494|nr:tRNA dimethylallyltransferase [Mesorhizobium albiziae]